MLPIKLMKKRTKKIGLPPGSLIHIGEKRTEQIKIHLFWYNNGEYQEHPVTSIGDCLPFKEKDGITWINIDGLHDTSVLETFGELFNIHPLVLEDILNTDQRPKVEDYEDYLYIVLKMYHYHPNQNEIEAEQVSLILGSNYVLSFQEHEGDVFDPIRERIRSGKGKVRKMGADYLVYALMDSIVDSCFPIIEHLVEQTETIENNIISSPSPEVLQDLHTLKRETLFFRKYVRPLRELVSTLERGDTPLIRESTLFYLRDLYDHSVQVMDTVETLREMLIGILDIYLSSMSNRMNNVMKVLTIIATIFIPLTFIVGIYGMNFKYMPELDWKWSYPIVWLVMLAVVGGMLVYFKNKKWL